MKKTPKQIAALICVALLVLLYALLFISAIFSFPGREKIFSAAVYGTITIPLLTWIYIYLYGKMKNKHTIASIDLGMTPKEAADQASIAKTDSEEITLQKGKKEGSKQ